MATKTNVEKQNENNLTNEDNLKALGADELNASEPAKREKMVYENIEYEEDSGKINNPRPFSCALNGIKKGIKSERNLKIQLVAAVFAIILAFLLDFNAVKWGIVILTIVAVLGMELMNTAIEYVVDLVCEGYNVKAGLAKDIAAGGVLVVSIGAFIIGIILYLPAFIEKFM